MVEVGCLTNGGTMLIFLQVIVDSDVRNKLETIYCLYNKEMFYVAYNILKDAHEAEDVVQTTILKLVDHLDKIEDVETYSSKGFVLMVSKNIARNIYKRRKNKEIFSIDDYQDVILDEQGITPEQYVLRLDNGHWVAKQLSQIKPEYSEILALRYTYEYSNKEIAKLIDITEGNVRIRLSRAKKALHRIIGGDTVESIIN